MARTVPLQGQNGQYYVPSSGAFWRGADGKVYVAGDQGVHSAGNWDANTARYWAGQNFSQIADPVSGGNNPPTNNNTYAYTGGGAGSGNAAAKAALIASLNNQEADVNAQINRLGRQRDVGFRNVDNAYNSAVNRLNSQKAIGQRNYNVGTQDTINSFLRSRNQIASDTSARLNSLRQLLGTYGSGNSSAAQYAAPYAATREGTQRLNPVQATYSTNRRNLDFQLDDLINNYNQQKEDASNQRYAQRNAVQAEINKNKASLLAKLNQIAQDRTSAEGGDLTALINAQSSRRAQINSLLDVITGLGNKYKNSVKVKDVAFKLPDLAKYVIGEQEAIDSDVPGAEDVDSSLLPILLGDRRQEDELAGVA